MLSEAIGAVFPTAIAVALSPIPIVAVIIMLGTPRARSNGPAFAAGWVVGLTAVSVIVLAITGGASDTDSATDTGVNWLYVALGLLFFGMARRQWQGRPKKGEQTAMPKWIAAVDSFTAGRSFALGVALSAINPKNLALTAAAAASIGQAGLSGGDDALAIAFFVVIGSITVAGSVLFYLVAAERAAGPLASLKDFMAEHNAIIMVVILVIFGAKLLGDGFAGVTN